LLLRRDPAKAAQVSVAGDYGGFDIGSSSHRTWSLAGFVSYRLGEHWDLAGGWHTLEMERGPIELEMVGPAARGDLPLLGERASSPAPEAS
jgi:hypothetical protein